MQYIPQRAYGGIAARISLCHELLPHACDNAQITRSRAKHRQHNKHRSIWGCCLLWRRIVCNSQADFLHKILFFGKDAKVFLRKHYFC